MRLFFDKNFKKNITKYIFQCSLATVMVLVVLIILKSMADTAIVAALGATSFIAFAMPHKEVSKPKYMIGGYFVGTVVGCCCHFWSEHYLLAHIDFIHIYSRQIFGSISVGLAIFIMTITDTEHPPAAGLALAFVLNGWNLLTVEVVFAGVVMISVIKLMLKRILINLV